MASTRGGKGRFGRGARVKNETDGWLEGVVEDCVGARLPEVAAEACVIEGYEGGDWVVDGGMDQVRGVGGEGWCRGVCFVWHEIMDSCVFHVLCGLYMDAEEKLGDGRWVAVVWDRMLHFVAELYYHAP